MQRLLFFSSLTRPFLRQGDKQEIVDWALLQMLNMVTAVCHADAVCLLAGKHLYRSLYEASSPHRQNMPPPGDD